jgi:hypothetical protein
MSQRMRENADLLRVLAKSTPKLRRAILQCCHNELIKAICEVTLNVFKKSLVPTNSQQKKKLRRFKKIWYALADKTISVKKKRDYLNQTGERFLSYHLPPVLSVLASFLSKKNEVQ